ncbi:MAG: DUF4114 domain-containing protein [Proteobacteria bacterium]|nr:DUF4114 domain-containing protein [Pseudomonadota bacterium]MBU1450240.1 DUF4114 domain-containing protein [Pseudomonadota bacterium]MBU2467166.1 DUF4114 domain-containing protein [Pseudomonadota bacterium]MBU2516718.1 DUF4114 domain-containing protein [Pseudomonadota bacterium]
MMRPFMLGLGGMLVAGWLALAGPTGAWADNVDMMGQIFHQDIPAEELAAIRAAFPEGSGLNPDFIAAANNPNLHFYQQATATFTFLGEGAGFKNTVGYFLFDDNGNILDMRTIFSNASGTGPGLAGGGQLNVGDSVVLGVFDAGTNLGFWLRADGYNNSKGKVYYTLEGLNPDQKRHYALWMDNANQRAVYGVEDLWNLGDKDYNDLLYSVSADPYSAINPGAAAPEPASLLLVVSGLAGLAGAGWRVRRRR